MESVSLLGDLTIDLIQSKDNRFIPQPGGSVFNTAYMLNKLGVNINLYSAAGDDFFGNFFLEELKKEKIDTSNIVIDKSYKTPLAVSYVDSTGEASYSFYKERKELNILPDNLNKTTLFHFGSSFALAEQTIKTVRVFIEEATKNNIIISYDPNIRKNLTTSEKDIIFEYFKKADIIKLSLRDGEYLFGTDSITEITSIINGSFNNAAAFITLGENGAAAFTKKYFTEVKGIEKSVVDTIGAGDSFNAGYLSMFIKEGFTDKKSIENINEKKLHFILSYANSIAAESTARKGVLFLISY